VFLNLAVLQVQADPAVESLQDPEAVDHAPAEAYPEGHQVQDQAEAEVVAHAVLVEDHVGGGKKQG